MAITARQCSARAAPAAAAANWGTRITLHAVECVAKLAGHFGVNEYVALHRKLHGREPEIDT